MTAHDANKYLQNAFDAIDEIPALVEERETDAVAFALAYANANAMIALSIATLAAAPSPQPDDTGVPREEYLRRWPSLEEKLFPRDDWDGQHVSVQNEADGRTYHILVREGGSVSFFSTASAESMHLVHWDSMDIPTPTPSEDNP